jgi:hypothetical protein
MFDFISTAEVKYLGVSWLVDASVQPQNRVNSGGSSRNELSRVLASSVIVYLFTLTAPMLIISVLSLQYLVSPVIYTVYAGRQYMEYKLYCIVHTVQVFSLYLFNISADITHKKTFMLTNYFWFYNIC